MGSSKKTMSTGGGGHSSTVLSLRPLDPTSAHMQGALKSIWEAIAPKGTLTREEFTTFLQEVQKETDPADVVAILGSVLPSGSSGNKVGMPEFFKYMCSPAANALRLPKQSEKDTSHQLTSYFISSSHNTYLVGHQLYGDSTTAGYINVLRRGCRCIEIDVWDGDNGEPEVFHGWTLTKEISFVDVCKAIRDHAFWEEGGEKVDGPVVISLECHCSAAQQEKMVEIMKRIWKGILVDAPICGAKTVHDVNQVPTLEQLRGKILVKTKYYPLDALGSAAQGVARMSLDVSQQQRQQQAPPRRAKTSPNTKETSSEDSSDDEELRELARESGHTKPKKVKITRALSDLAIYVGATHFPGTFSPAIPLRPTTVFSFSEKVFASHYATWPRELFHHNLRHFMRVYPFGLRFSSSNADPTQFWRRGVQLVALNWQKADEGMMLNEGMFAGEGGYVLKPAHFRPGPGGTPPPNAPPKRNLDLEIEVLACQNIPLPDDDDKPASFEPYVKIELHVDDPIIEGDEIKSRTKKASNKGTDATWDPKKKTKRLSKLFSSSKPIEDDGVLGEESHVVEKKSKRIGEVVKFKQVAGVRSPEMCFVRIRVHDEEFGRDDLAAWACVRLDRLKSGWRIVRLFDRKGRTSGGVLVVRAGWRLT